MGFRLLKRSPLFIVCALVLGSASHDARAWGFGRAQSSAVLGVPLDFGVGLRLEAGEAPPECLTAEVTVGDIPLPRSAVSVLLDATSAAPSVRVRTTLAIDEPLVSVNLSAGCASRVTRRFTLLADPPGHLAAPALASAEASPAGPAASTQVAASPQAAPTAAAPSPVTAPSPAPSPTAVSEPSPRAPAAGAGATKAGAEAAGASSKPPAAPRPRPAPDPTRLAEATPDAADKAKAARAARPRLQLDAPVVTPKAPAGGPARSAALLAAEEAASAARAAASAAEARAAAMEKNIEALRQEAKANRESLARLTQALQEAQGGSSTSPALWGALAGLGALAALLMVRLRRQQRLSGQAPWWSGGAATAAQADEPPEAPEAAQENAPALLPLAGPAPGAPASTAPSGGYGGYSPAMRSTSAAPGAERELPPLPMPEEMEPEVSDMERTQLLPPSASSVSAPIQGVSIEELLDLEQQVEFFTVLGQDDAALGLLVEHLRSTGGTYPLPYLKLLEIYRRKGDEDSYERTRDRFNQRFNAVAPAWGAPVVQDRHLEDFPDIIRKIQQAWPRPVDAMALLENMLVRTEGGTLLELSTLGEVLFLFTLARDLHEQEEGAAGPVDVLLPLDDLLDVPAPVAPTGADFGATQFAASSFAAMGIDMPAASAPDDRRASVAAETASASNASALDAYDADHFDLPLGEPMFEPVFDLPAPARAPAALPSLDLPPQAPPKRAMPSIDLPSLGGEDERPGLSLGSQSGVSAPDLSLDLAFDNPVGPGAGRAASDTGRDGGSEPALMEALSFDLPDLESVQAPLPSKPEVASPVDLDFSLDGLELEPLPPKLSPRQEQAASNFGLFNETPAPGKPR